MRRMLFCLSLLSLSVLPLSADEALHGSWQGSLVDEEQGTAEVVLTFEAGGVFRMDQRLDLGAEFQAMVQASQIAVENMTAQGTGTWEADGDRLRVSISEMEILVDGRDYLEILGEVAAALGHIAADLAGVSDADRPAFVAVFVNDFLGSHERGTVLPRVQRRGDLGRRGRHPVHHHHGSPTTGPRRPTSTSAPPAPPWRPRPGAA